MNKLRFTNRELSWLMFNERVLREALDNNNQLMEQLKFIGISASNLDEFFMVRVAGLIEQVEVGYNEKDIAGLTPKEQLKKIRKVAHKQMILQQDIFRKLQDELTQLNILLNPTDINEDISEILNDIFIDEILPIITPVTIDPAHPFPFIYNKRISILAQLEKDDKIYSSLIVIPSNMKRIFKVRHNKYIYFFTVEHIIKSHLNSLYKKFKINNSFIFRVTRDADLELQKEESDLLRSIQNSISKRNKGNITRIEIEPKVTKESIEFLKKMMNFSNEDILPIKGIIDLTFLLDLYTLKPNLTFPQFKSFNIENIPENSKIFNRIKDEDILFIRPYYSFSLVSNLISIAAKDPNVLAIKMTLYRTNKYSLILSALLEAAKNGKHVSVVIELKARFDEERNINWARSLEEAGCIVSYGIPGLKVHAKCLLIIRKEENGIKRYSHIATGNYNEITANIYTDIDLITADDDICRDVAQLFNYLTGYTEEQMWRKIFIAPFNLRDQLVYLIDKEIEYAKNGKSAKIIMKMNSLIDELLISKMYEASKTGVKIDLIIRGISGIQPKVKGLSDNIRVKSIIGRFLEHARVFYFYNGSNEKCFISSADLMPRNLNWRTELMVEITNNKAKKILKDYLNLSMEDNIKGWDLIGESYIKKSDDKKLFNSQEYFLNNNIIDI